MNAGQHYLAAEEQLDKAIAMGDLSHPIAKARVAIAQVHATLASVSRPEVVNITNVSHPEPKTVTASAHLL